MKANPAYGIPPRVRAAIRAFLKRDPNEAQPFAASKGRTAVRRVFPDPNISDTALRDAITSEASAAEYDIEADAGIAAQASKRIRLQTWDSGNGTTGNSPCIETQRLVDKITQRRARETKDRNELI